MRTFPRPAFAQKKESLAVLHNATAMNSYPVTAHRHQPVAHPQAEAQHLGRKRSAEEHRGITRERPQTKFLSAFMLHLQPVTAGRCMEHRLHPVAHARIQHLSARRDIALFLIPHMKERRRLALCQERGKAVHTRQHTQQRQTIRTKTTASYFIIAIHTCVLFQQD